jgi:phosphoribosylformylglycinamidine synthase II
MSIEADQSRAISRDEGAFALHRQLGLTDDEYARIEELLGRTPNRAELAMFSVMWSEHCSYKSSRLHLKDLPSWGPNVLMGPGEGAGVVKVGEVAVALRIESHNHPSFVEPFQGAATGVGGIIRDVLSVGARPIALADSLRFGPLPSEDRIDDEAAHRNRNLFDGVVSGVSSYGNCIGVPTVAGEVKFEDCYSGNPLVNVMCVGVAPISRIRRARAEGPGNLIFLVGSKTGRDGIGGVSVLASAAFGGGNGSDGDKRPSVQVGDPFTEKLLIEACLELMDRGLVVGIQDLGGAGLTCATSETAAKAENGMRIELREVPLREAGMEPFEILTSESQERMLLVVKPSDRGAVAEVCDRWGLDYAVIGQVVEGDMLHVSEKGQTVADVPAAALGDGPAYSRPSTRPSWLDSLLDESVDAPPSDVADAIARLIASPNIASKRWVWQQYDHQVILGTVVAPGRDAAVLRIDGTTEHIAITTDGNARFCLLDPYLGTMHAVAEAARNLSAVGSEPLALTNCLNFGNPEKPEVMWQFTEAIRGMAEAAAALGVPVTGGNVSFYNDTAGASIYPTPVIGMLGTLPESVDPAPIGFRRPGDVILLLGTTTPELGGSEYARTVLGKVGGRIPSLDLDKEAALGRLLRKLVGRGLVSSAHDCSEGGIAISIAESCIEAGRGAAVTAPDDIELYQWLFSESAARAIVSVASEIAEIVTGICDEEDVPVSRIGEVVEGDLVVQSEGSEARLQVAELRRMHESSIPTAMGYRIDDPGYAIREQTP